MGLRVYVYRWALQDCTNGGVSATVKDLTVVNADGPFDPTDDAPPAIITTNAVGDPIIVPADNDGNALVRPGEVGPMAGGNFAGTSDSRFRAAMKRVAGVGVYGAIPIHDRFETPEQYEALSR